VNDAALLGLIAALRSTIAFLVCGGGLIVAGGVIAAVNSAAPFAHGSWLAAYLVLVGGTAQILLAGGRAALVSGGGEPDPPRFELMLWNFGSLAVPAGVLADTAGLVTAGSIALLFALALFAPAGFQAGRARRRPAIAYLALIVCLASSVVVGSALANAAPGVWL
jgi:hypothetical protein